MQLSRDFSTAEFLRSRRHPQLAARLADVPAAHMVNMARLCFLVMQPLRDRFGPIKITSGYRPPALNMQVNGASSSSHLTARACDFIFLRTPARTAWQAIAEGNLKLNFDRIAYYPEGERFHVEVAEADADPRHRLYVADPSWREVTAEQVREQ